MSVPEIEARLKAASQRLDDVCKSHEDWDAFRDAYDQVLCLERELAAAKGEQYAVPLSLPVRWDVGAPLPYVFSSDYKAFLTFFLRDDPDPKWDGKSVTIRRPDSGSPAGLALIEFEQCLLFKFGAPNEDVQKNHPLEGRGAKSYTAQQVINSEWLAEVGDLHGANEDGNSALMRPFNHYILWFHDSTFECIAKSIKIELCNTSMPELMQVVCERLVAG